MARSKKYQDWLINRLKDHKEAVAYLNAALEESLKRDKESQEVFLMALRNVVEAHGGMSKKDLVLASIDKFTHTKLNKTTEATLKSTNAGKGLHKFDTLEEMFEDLGI